MISDVLSYNYFCLSNRESEIINNREIIIYNYYQYIVAKYSLHIFRSCLAFQEYISQLFSLIYFPPVGLYIVSYICQLFCFLFLSVINLRFGGCTNLQL